MTDVTPVPAGTSTVVQDHDPKQSEMGDSAVETMQTAAENLKQPVCGSGDNGLHGSPLRPSANQVC